MTPTDLLSAARSAGLRIVTAESCTGGLLSAALTEIPGSSGVFERGFVTYSNDAKAEMLGVDPALIESHGVVSEQVAEAMARGALERSKADVAVSITGIAGPGGSEHKPEGRVCFALAGPRAHVETVEFGSLGRGAVRAASVAHALDLLSSAVEKR